MTNTIRDYCLAEFTPDERKQICAHGMVSGFGNLIYYSDTNKWHDDHEDEIWNMLYADEQDQGVSIMQLIASFNGSKDVGSLAQLKNLLCWYAVERTCFYLVDEEAITNAKS